MKNSKLIQDIFRTAVRENNIIKVKTMIQEGFDVNDHGKTAINTIKTSYLSECCETNRLNKKNDPLAGLEIAELLLKNGALPNGRGSSIINPLNTAVSHGFIELVELLVQYGIKVIDDPYLLFNAHTIPMAKYLIENGIDINKRWNDGSTVLIRNICQTDDREYLTFLLNHSDLYAVNQRNETAFHIAALWCDLEFVKFLLKDYYDIYKCNQIKDIIDKNHEDQARNVRVYLKKVLSSVS